MDARRIESAAQLRTPEADGGKLLAPAHNLWPQLVALNQQQQLPLPWVDDSRHERELARTELVDLAQRFTTRYLSSPFDASAMSVATRPIVLSGHQPELFHPGVWFKNFALAQFASQIDGIPINLIVDNDVWARPFVRQPVYGETVGPTVEVHALDDVEQETPYEELSVGNPQLVDSFEQRVVAHSPWPEQILLTRIWPDLRSGLAAGLNVPFALARSRHQLEHQLNNRTLEVPLGLICDTNPFRRFVGYLLRNADQFSQIYNQQLAVYRQKYRVRSKTHPVPALFHVNDEYELPLWVWTKEDPRRQRLFVNLGKDQLQLRAPSGWQVDVPSSPKLLAEHLRELRNQGIKLRPRALLTTMYCRLVLSDWFIHGVGGGKYDRLTDLIIGQFFSGEPPFFGVASATFHLPFDSPDVTEQDLRDVVASLRSLTFHPEKCVETPVSDSRIAKLCAEKQRWIEVQGGNRKERHDGIVGANRSLQPYLDSKRHQEQVHRSEIERLLRHKRVLESREYAYCLFPYESLFPRLLELFC